MDETPTNGRCEDEDGNAYWFKDRLRHRVDGPAIEWHDGEQWWYLKGQHHRIDGPAMVWDRKRTVKWFLYDQKYSLNDWLSANTEISEEHKLMLKLQYG